MAEIAQLEQRITSALDRIARGLDERPAVTAETEHLSEELEIERAANARHVTIRAEHEARIERLDIKLERLTERLQGVEGENKRLHDMVAGLQSNNAALRDANAQHQGAGEQINAALATELDDLKATRAADIAELEDVLSELAPLVKEA